MPATVSHALSATTPDDPAYEIRPTHWNSNHLFTLNAVGSEISGAFSNAAGQITFGLETNGFITAQAPAGGGGITAVNVSAGTTSNNLSALTFSNSNGISFGLASSTITASYTVPSTAGLLSAVNISAGTTSTNKSNFTFSNANGLSFGLDTGANAGIITGSYTVPSVTNSSWTVSDSATSGTVARLAFTGSNGITMGLSTGAGGSHTVTASYTVPSTAGLISAINISAGTTSTNKTNFTFSNANGISFGLDTGANAGIITGSHNALTSQSNQAFSAAGGSSAFQTLGFSDNAAGSFTNTNGSLALASVRASLYATSNTTQGTSITQNLNSLIFAGAGIASVGATNGSIVISVPSGGGAGDGGVFAGVSTAGNTDGSTGTVSTGNFVLVGSGPISLSQSTGAAGSAATVTINGPATSSLVGTNGISVSSAGSTISVLPQWISSYENMPGIHGSQTMTLNGASVSHAVAFELPQPVSASFIRMPVLLTTQSRTATTLASATASANLEQYSTWNMVVYSMGVGANSKSLQSVTSSSIGFTHRVSLSITNSSQGSYTHGFSAHALGAGTTMTTQYSVSAASYSVSNDGVFSSFSSNRMMDFEFANSLTPGAYWLVFGYSSSSASSGAAGLSGLTAASIAYSNHYGASQPNLVFGLMGSSNMTSGAYLGAGSFSTAGGGTTNSIPLSAISSSASHVRPYFQFQRSA